MAVSATLKTLFSSKLRVKVLAYFFFHPGDELYVRRLASELDEPVGTVARELAHLQRAGVLASQRVGNQKHYRLSEDCPILEDLRNIFLKTAGAGAELRRALEKIPGVELAFLYGSTVLLLRVRYLVEQPGQNAPLLSEEVIVRGYSGSDEKRPNWLDGGEALRLLTEAKPDANVAMAEKRQPIGSVLAQWPPLESALREQITDRATELEKSHKRVRQAVSLRTRELTVKPQLPPDLLGVLVLQPVV